MSTGQISQYFAKSDGNKQSKSNKTMEKKEGESKGDQNPSKRTRSELSSVDSEASEAVGVQILEELKDIKEKLNDTVKTNDLKGMVKGIVSELMKEMKDEIKQDLNDLKQNYDAKLLSYKSDVDSLNVDNHRLRALVTKQNRTIADMKKTVKESNRIAMESKARANRNEQYSRKTNIKIHGVDDMRLPNSKMQGTQATVQKVLKESIKVDLKSDEIIACHRIPGRGTVRPILLKVKNTDIKSRIMRNRTAFRESKQNARLSDDVTKDNSDLIQKLIKNPAIESAWYFNCSIYAKLKKKEGEKEKPEQERRIMFDINDNIDKKIRKHMAGEQLDANDGYKTESESESDEETDVI